MRDTSLRVLAISLLALVGVACAAAPRTTTTPRTATEQALLSQAAESTVENLAIPKFGNKSFFVIADWFEATDGKYILAQVEQKLLLSGLRAARTLEQADILVYPSVANAAIDESGFLLGFPSVGIPVPGVGVVNAPELALLKREVHRGRNRMTLLGRYATGELAFWATRSTERYYDRWTVFFFISFRRTDLDDPF